MTAAAKRNVRFTTAPFVRAHGKQPRGFGNWAFQRVESTTAFDRERTGPVLFETGTLTEAKAKVSHQFKGAATVAVLP